MDADLTSAVAASVAAMLSGLTLWMTVLREERRWRRDALVHVLADFLDASFSRPGHRAFQALQEGAAVEQYLALADEAVSLQVRSLTRLRLLGSRQLVECAITLFDVENEIHHALLVDPALPQPLDFGNLYERRRRARTAVLRAARSSLRLGRARSVEPGLHRPVPKAGRAIPP